MNRSGALKLTAILLVLVLCISTIGIGLQLASKGTSSVGSVDASTNPIGQQPLNTGEGSPNSGLSSGTSNGSNLLADNFFGGDSLQYFLTGNYGYRALYASDCTNLRISTCTRTVLSADSITYGMSITDVATVTASWGSVVPTGTVDFQVKIGESGAWNTYVGGNDIPLVDGSAVSGAYTPATSGTYYFRAVYSGDSNFYCSQSRDGAEKLTVSPASTTITTIIGASEISLGRSVTDNATVTGLGSNYPVPTGTATFMVKAPGGTYVQYGEIKTLDCNGKAVSDMYLPLMAGTYQFKAVYAPAANNILYSACSEENEQLTVVKACSGTTTVLSSESIAMGSSITDTAIVTGVDTICDPTGTVTFMVKVPGTADFVKYGDVKTLDASGQAVSDAYTPLEAGTFYFKAVYGGDCNYLMSADGDCAEPLEVIQCQSSTTTTELGVRCITLGQSVFDNATVTGLGGNFPTPTGSVTFWVSADNGASWTQYGCAVELCAGSATSSESYTPLATGLYLFKAIYSGDDNLLGSESAICDEQLTVNPSASTTHTELGAVQISLGQSVSDNATVQGLGGDFPTPTGTVDFQVRYNCGSWSTFDAGVELVDGTATSKMYKPTIAGDYEFRAVYSGDNNYQVSGSAVCEEPLKVLKAATKTHTCLGTDSIVLGQSVRDNATVIGVAGSPAPSGTVSFYVSADGGQSWTMVGSGPVSLNNGRAQSEWYMPLEAGDYLFKAVYSGDSNYLPSESRLCSEPLHVEGTPTEIPN